MNADFQYYFLPFVFFSSGEIKYTHTAADTAVSIEKYSLTFIGCFQNNLRWLIKGSRDTRGE